MSEAFEYLKQRWQNTNHCLGKTKSITWQNQPIHGNKMEIRVPWENVQNSGFSQFFSCTFIWLLPNWRWSISNVGAGLIKHKDMVCSFIFLLGTPHGSHLVWSGIFISSGTVVRVDFCIDRYFTWAICHNNTSTAVLVNPLFYELYAKKHQ